MMSRLSGTVAVVRLLTLALTSSISAAETNQTTSVSETSPHIAPVAQRKQMCRLPPIFACRPEPLYCRPEPVCIGKSCRPCPRYCHPETVCKYSICRPKPWLCKPEPVCRDPEPRCCPESAKGNDVVKHDGLTFPRPGTVTHSR